MKFEVSGRSTLYQTAVALFFTIILLYMALSMLSVGTYVEITTNRKARNEQDAGKTRKIFLLANSFYDERMWGMEPGNREFVRLNCPEKNCYITDDEYWMNKSDVVIFHAHELGAFPTSQRLHNQYWVFFMLESPEWSTNMAYSKEPWRSAFNLTMTYRLDSDIPIPYGSIHRVARKKVTKDYSRVAEEKYKMVAWFASNCHTQSERAKYVAELQKYIPVDVYGRCGNNTCQRLWQEGDHDCNKLVNDNYLFYLAFENSLCKGYITEKFFKVLTMDVVPIVRGARRADYKRVAHHNWYINVDDFQSPQKLAEYLWRLKGRPEQYAKYFNFKENYRFEAYYGISELPEWCQLCEKINQEDREQKVIRDITTWWKPGDCDSTSV